MKENVDSCPSTEEALDAVMLADSVRRALAASAADDETSWRVAVELGLPLLCSAPGMGVFEDALLVVMELGRRATTAPVLEAIILNRVAPGLVPPESKVALAVGEMGGDVSTGTLAIKDGMATGALRLVEGAARADYLVVVDPAGVIAAIERDAAGVAVEETPALGPDLCDVRLKAAALCGARPLANGADELLAMLRIGLCARALGAAWQGFDLVVDYARIRRQFGQAIGAFQAIQHKLADSHIVLEASCRQLLGAARAFDQAWPARRARAAAAVGFASSALRKVALETQHCFGAIGYAEEHGAPALFRRVHADVARFGGAMRAHRALGAWLLDAEAGALQALLSQTDDPSAGFRARLRAWLGDNWTAADRAALAERPFEDRDWDLDFLRRLGRDGWTTLNWPVSAGGMAASPFEQLAFVEEMHRADAPAHASICPCRIIAPEIIAHGGRTLKEQLLPLIRAGAVTGCLGYSEPEAGSDLASLRTTARRDGDSYVINGQKIWTTDGHRATHMILAARTGDGSQARQAGISLFILPMDTAGISVRPMKGLHGHVFCAIFFDDVRISADWRLGDEGQGWSILGSALASERIGMGAFASRLVVLFDRLVDRLRETPGARDDSATAVRIGELAARLVSARELALASVAAVSPDKPALIEAAAAKIYASELAQALCETGLDLVGGAALLGGDAGDAPVDGLIEEILRLSILYVVGGGSNEIQRSMIAIRGLGLGR